MARTVRLSVALVIALIMMMALAGTALAFKPPGNSGLTGVGTFPAIVNGNPDFAGGGPWNATGCGASVNPSGAANGTGEAPIGFDDTFTGGNNGADCPQP